MGDRSLRRESMLRVTPITPCPVCKKHNWCLIAPDGSAAICQRVESGKKCGDAGWLHRLNEPVPPPPPRPRRPAATPTHWPSEAAKYAAAFSEDRKQELAILLKLPADVFAALPLIGFRTDTSGPNFTFPEVGPDSEIIGINRRYLSGSKRMIGGGNRGLTIPTGWQVGSGVVLVVEGPTDVLALHAAGLAAVGRPSNGGGAELLGGLFQMLPTDCDIVVVGENDRKPGGRWPGRAGAEATARKLAASLGRPIWWSLPPADAKDARDWLTAAARGETAWADRGRELNDYLSRAAETVLPPTLYSARPELSFSCRPVPG